MKHQRGQSLIELLIAIALAAVILPGIMFGLISSREGKAQEGQRLQAFHYLKEAEDVVSSLRAEAWSNIATNNTYHPVSNGTRWNLATGSEVIDGIFTRQLVISSVQRDSNGNIVSSGGVTDPSTKKIDYTVSWTDPIAGSVISTEYLQRYLGNTTFVDTTQADFGQGTFNNSESNTTGGGAVQLSAPGSSSYNFTDDYDSPANYTYDSNKIEVTGGYAQLKAINTPVSGATTNPGFNTVLTPWTFVSFGTNNGQTGTRVATGGNPGAYARVNFPKVNNPSTSGGLLYQGFTTTAPSATGTLTFNWEVTAYQATPTSFHLYAWLDTVAAGSPITRVWDSGNITGTSGWSGTVTVNVSPQLITAGTYYLKVGGVVVYPAANRGPYTIGYDNVLLSWSGTATTYDSSSPAIYPISSFIPSNVSAWTSFSATEVANGGSIMYQLSDDNGATWKYWSGSGWTTATLPTHYNSAATVNQFINAFSAAAGQIKVRAFLISSGTQFVRLDKIVIGYQGSVFPNQGDYISATMDAGANAGFNNITWTEVNTANTTTKFQIATNSDNATWNYVGPDGTSSTYFTGGFGTINLSNVSGRYLRYKIFFTSTNTDIPYVTDVTVNYSP